jgi:SSS family solute:Na+ symporter
VTAFAALLLLYALGLIGVGIWAGRRVRQTSDFFVAGRSLGPGLIFATFLAANLGAGTTVGATGYAYQDGLAAWWWDGSAGIGSLILAFWIGPIIWREAHRLGLLTVGDFLEHHFGRGVRGLGAFIVWAGSFAILCGQLRGAGEVLERIAGIPLNLGAFLAAAATVSYFVAGGLVSAARVNVVQVCIVLAGFGLAAPFVAGGTPSWSAVAQDTSFWRGSEVGWPTLLLLGPAFFLSPGLLQKGFGAQNTSALRRGVALNGLTLIVFACLPVLFGLAARALFPDLPRRDMAMPALFAEAVPPAVGAFALVAVLSAEISTADAVLFMLATSGARDFYKGFLRPSASDRDVLRVARLLAVVGGLVGFGLTFVFDTIGDALTFFYRLMTLTLAAPILGGLFLPRAGRGGALAAILVGVVTYVTIEIMTQGAGYGWAAPHLVGLAASAVTYLILAIFN